MDKDILKLLNALGLEKKANEVMNTSVAGGGQELVPDKILAQEIFEAVPKYGTFIGALPGFHGYGLDKSVDVPVIGMVEEFEANNEWTAGAIASAAADGRYVPTAEVTLNQKGFIAHIALSRDLLNYSRVGDLEALVRRKLSEAAALTVESAILNGDPDASNNVNYDGGSAPASAYYRQIGADGLRCTAITASDTYDVGSMDFADYAHIQGMLGDYGAIPADCMWLLGRPVYTKALSISEFENASLNGRSSTVFTGALTNILGSDLFIPKRLQLAQATAKVHYSTGNTTGQIVYFWKPAVQYGFGAQLELGVEKVVGKGVMLHAAFDLGLAIVNKKASVSDPSVVVGRNVTV